MKKYSLILLIAIVLAFLTSCTTVSLQEVTSDNIRTVRIQGFSDAVDAEHISISEDGLEVCRIGNYTGTFVEQGTDTDCKDIPAIVVQNTSGRMIEKTVLVQGSQTFVITYLPPDGICLVQNQSGKPADPSDELYNLVFREPVQFAEEAQGAQTRVHVETDENLITIQNISGEDIPGSVNVWYKTKQNGLYIGGVSYKAAVDHGILKADSTATVQTSHFDPEHSELLLVTFSE